MKRLMSILVMALLLLMPAYAAMEATVKVAVNTSKIDAEDVMDKNVKPTIDAVNDQVVLIDKDESVSLEIKDKKEKAPFKCYAHLYTPENKSYTLLEGTCHIELPNGCWKFVGVDYSTKGDKAVIVLNLEKTVGKACIQVVQMKDVDLYHIYKNTVLKSFIVKKNIKVEGVEIQNNYTIKNMNKEQIKEMIKRIVKIARVNRSKRIVLPVEPIRLRLSLKGNIDIDGEKLNLTNKEIQIQTRNGNISVKIERNAIRIMRKNMEIIAKVPIELNGSELLINGTRKIVDPEKLIERLRIRNKVKVKLKIEGNRPVYEAEAEEEGKLLGLIPIRMKLFVKADAETGRIIEEKKPWWSIFLVK